MRIALTGLWTIELDGPWERRRPRRPRPVTTWTGPIGTLRVLDVHTATPVARAGDRQAPPSPALTELLTALGEEVPPDPVSRVDEPGPPGTGHRTAWVYPDALWAYTFLDRRYLRTVFLSADADLRWAFTAWRSVRHGSAADQPGSRGA